MGAGSRTTVSVLFYVGLGLGRASMSLAAWASPDWRSFSLLTSAPLALFLLVGWALPESPGWLLSQGEAAQAADVILRFSEGTRAKWTRDELICFIEEPEEGVSSLLSRSCYKE